MISLINTRKSTARGGGGHALRRVRVSGQRAAAAAAYENELGPPGEPEKSTCLSAPTSIGLARQLTASPCSWSTHTISSDGPKPVAKICRFFFLLLSIVFFSLRVCALFLTGHGLLSLYLTSATTTPDGVRNCSVSPELSSEASKSPMAPLSAGHTICTQRQSAPSGPSECQAARRRRTHLELRQFFSNHQILASAEARAGRSRQNR